MRAALAALLLLIAIAGIGATGPGIGRTLPAHSVVLAIGCALEAVLAILLILLRGRGRRTTTGQAGSGTGAGGTEDLGARLRRPLRAAIVACMIAMPLAALLDTATPALHPGQQTPRRRPERLSHIREKPVRLGHGGHLAAFVEYLFLAIAAALVIALVIAIWRHRTPRLAVLDPPDTTDTPAELARAVDSGRAALRELDDARAAIIRCYLAMEGSLAQAGASRGIAETPDELLGRAASAGLVDSVPAGQLTALFYEARFSSHPMPPSRRDEAERALAQIAARLAVRDTDAASQDSAQAATT